MMGNNHTESEHSAGRHTRRPRHIRPRVQHHHQPACGTWPSRVALGPKYRRITFWAMSREVLGRGKEAWSSGWCRGLDGWLSAGQASEQRESCGQTNTRPNTYSNYSPPPSDHCELATDGMEGSTLAGDGNGNEKKGHLLMGAAPGQKK